MANTPVILSPTILRAAFRMAAHAADCQACQPGRLYGCLDFHEQLAHLASLVGQLDPPREPAEPAPVRLWRAFIVNQHGFKVMLGWCYARSISEAYNHFQKRIAKFPQLARTWEADGCPVEEWADPPDDRLPNVI